MAVGGVSPNNPNVGIARPSAQQISLNDALKEMTQLMGQLQADRADLTNESTSTSATSFIANAAKAFAKNATSDTQKSQKTRGADYVPGTEEAAAQSTGLVDEKEIKRKQREKKLQDRLRDLLDIVSNMDLAKLSGEDQEVVEEFLNNARIIGKLNREYDQLSKQEILLEEKLKAQKQ